MQMGRPLVPDEAPAATERVAMRLVGANGYGHDDENCCDVSIVIPFLNEEDNLPSLYNELTEVMAASDYDYEVLFVDDGSKDRSVERLRAVAADDPRVSIIRLRRNFGQTAAMCAGFEHSRGRIIIPMDADLQNDPHDIPAMIAKLDEGYDIVSGWRKKRQDKVLTRKIPSLMANRLIRKLTGVEVHDFGCTLKAYRREVIDGVGFYSELHRFLPALAVWNGAKITEMVVNHRPRLFGKTKYGLKRTLKVLLDLVTVKFFGTYMTKPLYFFGKLAWVTMLCGFITLMVAVAQKYGYLGQPQGLNLNNNVLLPFAALWASFSVQCILFGVVAELLVRIYHDGRGRPTYRIREVFYCSPNGGAKERLAE